MKYFVEDLMNYKLSGFQFNSKDYEIEIGNLVCDARARAFLLNVKLHSAYYCCTKCTQKGEHYKKRIIFPLKYFLKYFVEDLMKYKSSGFQLNSKDYDL